MIRISSLFCVLILSSAGWGQSNGDSAEAAALKSLTGEELIKYSKAILDKAINQGKDTLCSTKKSESQKALKEFNKLCSKAGLSSGTRLTSKDEPTYPGSSCLGQIVSCRECRSSDSADDAKCLPSGIRRSDFNFNDDDDDESDKDGFRSVLLEVNEILNQSKKVQQPISEAKEVKKAAKAKYKGDIEKALYCAPHAATGHAKLDKEQKDLAKERRDLKKDAREAHDSVLDLAKKLEDEERDLDNELEELEEQRTSLLEAAAKIGEDADEEQSKLTSKHSELATRIQEIYTQMEMVQLEHQDKELQQLAKCRENAMKSLEGKWKALAERRSRSRDNAGGLVAALAKVGANDETRADREVIRLRNKCYNQEEARRSRELFTKGTQARMDALSREIATSQRVMGEIRAAIQNIPTKKVKALEKLNAKLQKLNEKINKAHQSKQAFIQRKFQRTQIASKASADAQDAADAVEAQYSVHQRLLRDLRKIRDAAGIGEVDEKDESAFGEVEGAASEVLRALQDEETTCLLAGEDKVSPSTKGQIESFKKATGVQ